ncbi:MAG: hypothetical protein LQ346_008807 [Caloplaca aetnensis]|nr:MAG: hypothetical protein LQ346_008807 [Caloplaca aetnensis]
MSLNPSDFAQLIGRIQTLPRELKDQIEESVYEAGLSGGFLHLDGGSKHCDGQKSLPTPNTRLLTVDKHVAARYGERIYSENTLVIAMAKPWIDQDYILLEEVPESLERFESIRKLHLDFSTRAIYENAAEHWPPRTPISGPGSVFREEFGDLTSRVWMIKSVIGHLKSLEKVTFDFTECYGPKGKWWGRRLAYSLCAFSDVNCKMVDAFPGIDVEVQCLDPRQAEFIRRYVFRAEDPWEGEDEKQGGSVPTGGEAEGEEEDSGEERNNEDDMDLDGSDLDGSDLDNSDLDGSDLDTSDLNIVVYDSDDETVEEDARPREDMDGGREGYNSQTRIVLRGSEKLRDYCGMVCLHDGDCKPASTT